MNAQQFKKLNQQAQAYKTSSMRVPQLLPNKIETVTRENDNIYLNIIMNHDPLTMVVPALPALPYETGTSPTIANYNTTKTTYILDRCSDYYAAVVRFSIPLDTIPIFIMPIVPNQSNPNLTSLFIGISYGGIDYPIQLIYAAANNISPPVQNQPSVVVTPYYYVYSYQVLIDMINVALSKSFAASPLPGLIGSSAVAPYFYYDPASNLVSLIVQPYFSVITSSLISIASIFVNSLLQIFLDSFDFLFIAYDNINHKDFQFILNTPTCGPMDPIQTPPLPPTNDKIYYPPNFGLSPGTNTILFYRFIEEYSVLEYWSSLRKILISTSNIPINSETVPANDNSSDINVLFPILTDFVPQIEQSAGTSRTIAFYIPSGQYRLVDLTSDQPLQKVDLRIYWQDKFGNLYPLDISVFQQVEIKIGFFRKDLYKGPPNILLRT